MTVRAVRLVAALAALALAGGGPVAATAAQPEIMVECGTCARFVGRTGAVGTQIRPARELGPLPPGSRLFDVAAPPVAGEAPDESPSRHTATVRGAAGLLWLIVAVAFVLAWRSRRVPRARAELSLPEVALGRWRPPSP